MEEINYVMHVMLFYFAFNMSHKKSPVQGLHTHMTLYSHNTKILHDENEEYLY
jgi:hypothetical protein